MYDGLHHELMPLFQSILFLLFKTYFSESAILMLLLCTEFLIQESDFFFIVFCNVKALYVLVSAVCCLHLAFIFAFM